MARQSDDQRKVHLHLLPRSSLALPDLTHEPVQACRSLPDSWLPSSTTPGRRAVVEIRIRSGELIHEPGEAVLLDDGIP